MADNMDLQITISGQNDTGSSFSSVDSQMNTLNELAANVTRTFQSFIDTITSAFSNAGRSVEELTRPLESVSSEAATAGRSLEDMTRTLFDTHAETAANDLARSIGQIGAEAQNTTREIQGMEEAASRQASSRPPASGGGHGESGGLFSMQGQMDSMYAGMSLGAAALPFVGAIKASTDAYGQFSQAMANVNSMMGLSAPQLDNLSNKVMELAKTVPDGPVALANALYGIVGAGVPAADQMAVLTTASKAATAGQTDVSTATSALIAVMNSYGLKGKDVTKISDQMFAANAAGAMTFDSFARSIGNVAGPAAQAGVGFDQVAAATAALTNQGMTAQRATEGLRALLVGVMSPTAGATKEAKKLGIEWDANALKSKGMTGMINEAMKATHGNSQELKKLIPNIAAWTDAIDLGGKGADSFKQAMQTMSQSAGSTDKAMEEQKKGFQEQMNEMKNSLQTAEIAFAKGFIPVLTDVAAKLARVAEWFSKLSPSTQKLIGEVALGAAAFLTLGSAFFMTISSIGALISGLSTLRTAMSLTKIAEDGTRSLTLLGRSLSFLMGPWGLLIAAIAIGAVLIITHWSQIKSFLTATWSAITQALTSAWNTITNTTRTVWNGITTFFKQWGTTLLAVFFPVFGIPVLIAQHWGQITAFATQIWNSVINTIKSIWNGAVNWIKGVAQAFVNIIVDAFNWMYNHNYYFQDLVDFIRNAWNTAVNDAKAIWNSITSFLSSVWNGIVSVGKTTWNGFVNILSTVWNAISSVATSFWNREVSGWENIWNGTVSAAKSIWNGLSSFFTGLWNTISSAVSSAWNSIHSTVSNQANAAVNAVKTPFNALGSFFSGLWGQAEQWGANLVNMMAQGIKNAAGAVGNAVKSVASSIAGFLGFHSPTKEGPGSDADTWMPNMIRMFTEGIQSHAPQLQMAIGNVALGVKAGFTSPLTQNISSTMALPGSTNNSTQPVFNVYVSGNITKNEQQLGDMVSRAIWDKAKMQGRF